MGKKLTIQDIENNGWLIYKFLRGSRSQGLELPTSDYDIGGVFLTPPEQLLGLGFDYQDEVSNETNDIVYYSLKKYLSLLIKSNPTVLESLFIPDRCVIYEHSIITDLKSMRQEFITKACFPAFYGYARQQIIKAQGLKKKIVNPVEKRLWPLDFCYTFYKQGSSKVRNFLEYRAIPQKYIGLVNVPNMHDMYSAFVDWGNMFLHENITIDMLLEAYRDDTEYDTIKLVKDIKNAKEDNESVEELETSLHKAQFKNMVKFIIEKNHLEETDKSLTEEHIIKWFNEQEPAGYSGIVREDGKSNEVRLSSTKAGILPDFYMSFNFDSYKSHCVEYKNYMDWVEHRNPERFRINVEHGRRYDSKNMAHSVRLIHCGLEIAKTGVFNVDRTGIDRDFILSVKKGEMTYEFLIDYVQKKNDEMNAAMKASTLPEAIDVEKVNNWLIGVLTEQFKKWIYTEK